MTKDELMAMTREQILTTPRPQADRTGCTDCTYCAGCVDCADCTCCTGCVDCADCTYCYKSSNQFRQQHMAFNVQLSEAEYKALMAKIA